MAKGSKSAPSGEDLLPLGGATPEPGKTDDAILVGRSDRIQQVKDIVAELKARDLPQAAWQDPAHNFQNNTMAALKLFDAATRREHKPLVVFASSSSADDLSFFAFDFAKFSIFSPMSDSFPEGAEVSSSAFSAFSS